MRNKIWIFAPCAALLLGTVASVHPQAPAKKLRVGTYDSRAIAVAFAPSKKNPVGEKMKEFELAKAAGDEVRVKELEAWGEKQQRKLHRQGFGRVPVDDLLAHVKDQLPALAAKAGVDVISMQCDFTSPNVEVIDVTDALVSLFDPSEQTLGYVKDLKQRAPLDLDEIEKDHDH